MDLDFQPVFRKSGDFQQGVARDDIMAMCFRALGSDSDIVSIIELGTGMFNNVYRIELCHRSTVILRVAPKDDFLIFRHEKDLMRREYGIQPWMASCSDIIPKFLFADFSGDIAGRDYVFQDYLSGEVWDTVKDRLIAEENEDLWRQLGAVAARFHSIRGSGFGFPHKSLHASWSEAFYEILDGMNQDLVERNLDTSGVPEFISLARRCEDILNEVEAPVLVHGDLWEKNIIIDRSHLLDGSVGPRITGVLDSDRCIWGDPMNEWIFSLLPVGQSFWEGYGFMPEGRTHSIRALLYRGQLYIQLFLESWRYKWDDKWCREGLTKVCRELIDVYGL